MVDLNEDLMDNLYDQEKILVEDVNWELEHPEIPRYSTKAMVKTTDSDEILQFHGEYWGKRFSFVLRYQNTVIRLWDFNDHHNGISGGHKHKFPEDEYKDDDPYAVDDVSTSDVNQALLDFLEECNIRIGDATISKITGLNDYE